MEAKQEAPKPMETKSEESKPLELSAAVTLSTEAGERSKPETRKEDKSGGESGTSRGKKKLVEIVKKVIAAMPKGAIYFYERPTKSNQTSHFFLSVHFPCIFKGEDGREYHSCTDYYHTTKLTILGDAKAAEEVHKLESPDEAYDLARKLQKPYESTPKWNAWKDRKVDVMRTAIRLKFQQNSGLMQDLLMTGDKNLVEEHPTDSFWYSLKSQGYA